MSANLLAFDIANSLFGGNYFLNDLGGVGKLIAVLLNNAIAVAGVILVVLILIAGVNLVAGGGNPQKIEQSKNIATYAIIGFIIVVFSYMIIRVVETITGISILNT